MKKYILLLSGIITAVFVFIDWIGTYKICGKYSVGDCPFLLHNIIIFLLPFVSLFFLSLITYKMRDEIFKSWIKFAYVWVPLTIILTFLAPEYGNNLLPVEKGSVSFFMSAFFLIISLIIILIKYFSSKK